MENYLNYTTGAPPSPQSKDNTGIYCLILIPIVLIALAILATVFYLKKRKRRSDELRHRLVPVYMYDPAEQDQDDLNYDSEQEVEKPLQRYGRLSVGFDYGTDKYR
ncbi:unnamed protein product [Knipowitschia caucasica]|uniref:Uncharacterized protein n=1 Tax=Knipowitschia caucasica TaxID=637954 RepID=A0AAV2L239_KNICA